MRPLEGILPFTRSIIGHVIQKGDMVVDATMGNGFDTLFLAQLVGPTGTVLAYDIQEEALLQTRNRLNKEGALSQVHLFLKGHQTVAEELHRQGRPLAGAMFNLGYRPGGNKEIVTDPVTTMKALHTLRHFLKKEGLITLVIYSGHEQGKKEKEALLCEFESWDQQQYQVLQYQFINQKKDPPFLVAIQKR